MKKSAYARFRQRTLASAYVDIRVVEAFEKFKGSAMTVEEWKRNFGYVDTKGRFHEKNQETTKSGGSCV